MDVVVEVFFIWFSTFGHANDFYSEIVWDHTSARSLGNT